MNRLPPALCAAWLLAGCGSTHTAKEEAVQVMERFTMTQTEKGRRVWRLSSPRARFTLEGRGFLERPEIEFYSQGAVASRARAKEAFLHGGSQDLALVGDVVITSLQERSTLRTRRLRYGSKEKRFRTDEAVVIERPGAVVRGRGLEADSTLSEIDIYHQETEVR